MAPDTDGAARSSRTTSCRHAGSEVAGRSCSPADAYLAMLKLITILWLERLELERRAREAERRVQALRRRLR